MELSNALWVETRKVIRSRVPLFTTLGFLVLPLAMAFLMFVYKDPSFAKDIGLVGAKAELAGGSADWPFYLSMFAQGIAVGGILLFSLIESWIFGREFADGTLKDLLAVPTSRGAILAAKFIVSAAWSLTIILVITLVGLALGALLQLPLGSPEVFTHGLTTLFVTTCLVILSVFPVAFFASVGRGYLFPMGIAILLLVLANVIAIIGYGSYFPWAIPGMYAGFSSAVSRLGIVSYLIVAITGLMGVLATYLWWKYADQSK